MTRRHIFITGVGRSGTNWLLELFDLAPDTFCRNEPNSWEAPPFRALPCRWLVPEDAEPFTSQWRAALAWITSHAGERDLPVVVDKVYTPALARALHLRRLLYGRRTRRAVGWLRPRYRRAEYPIPTWWIDPAQADAIPYVIKLNDVAGWLAGALRFDAATPVIQIARHPGGFLNSWRSRYLRVAGEEKVLRESRDRLVTIARHDPKWAERFGDVDAMDVDELELWYWRYSNETIHAAGRQNHAFRRVVFERVAARPIEHLRELYLACGLDWDRVVEARVAEACRASVSISKKWVDRLTPAQCALVERILSDSPLASWWEDDPGA